MTNGQHLKTMADDTKRAQDDGRLKHLEGLAANAFAARNYEKAAAAFSAVLSLKRRLLPSDHPDLGAVHMDLARTLLWLGKPDEAYRHAAEALEIFQGHSGPGHISLVDPLAAMAEATHETGADEDAVDFMQRAIEILEQDFGPDHMVLAPLLLRYAKILRQAGEETAAVEADRRGHRIYAANKNYR